MEATCFERNDDLWIRAYGERDIGVPPMCTVTYKVAGERGKGPFFTVDAVTGGMTMEGRFRRPDTAHLSRLRDDRWGQPLRA